MKLYLDTNIYFRPLDDRAQSKIALEAEACLEILELIENNQFTVYGSDILLYEIKQASQLKQSYIMPFVKYWYSQIFLTQEIIDDAELIQKKYHLKSRDALHLACAALSKSTDLR